MAMTVEELFQKLSYGELSNLAAAVDGTGTIKKEQRNRIIHFANEGLKRLHLRFHLRQRDLMINTAKTAQIISLDEDVIDIIAILNAYGEPVPFSTNVRPGEFYVQCRKLYVPAESEIRELMVNFHIRHPVLNPIEKDTDLAQNIRLAPELQPALTAYIAAEMYGAMNSPDAIATAAGLRNKFEGLCVEASNLGVVPSEMRPTSKFDERGFV